MRKLREGSQIELEASGDKGVMMLRSGRSTFTLACLPPEDYPLMAGGELPHSFPLAASELKTLIDRTRFAISTEETRYYLNGIFLHATKSSDTPVLRAVATDGHRLARVEMPLPEGAAGMPGVIVPRKTVTELRKLIDETDQEIGVALSDTKIRFTFGDAVLTSKLIDGTFPDYDRVIPTGNDKILEVELQGVRRGGRPRLDDLDREEPRGEAVARPRHADAVGDQPGERHGDRGDRGALQRDARSRSASTRAICSTSPTRSTARARCSRWPTPPRRPSCTTAPGRARSMSSCRCACELPRLARAFAT